MTESDERSLRDLLLESADDLEHVLKMIVDTLINRDRSVMLKNGETVENIIRLFHSKQEHIKKLLKRVPEFQERELLTRTLESHVAKRDEVIQQVENNLKACEVALTRSCFHANQKLKQMKEAELRPVNSEMLIKVAHQISKHNSVSAPLTWQIGDPSRPFPQEHEFRAGHLLNPKTQSAGPQLIPGKNPAQKPLNAQVPRVPSANSTPIRTVGTPLANSAPLGEYSPRTGYGDNKTPPIQLQVQKGATPNEKQWQNPPTGNGNGTSSQSPYNRVSQSPSASPNMKLKITGLPSRSDVDQVDQVRDVGEMSSDSSNSSDSSDDEGPSKKTVSSNKS